MPALPPINAFSTNAKVITLSSGVTAGLGVGLAAKALLPSSAGERRLEERGISTMSDLELRATFAPLFMFGAAAVGAGIGKRSGSAALTTASLGAAAMLASPASGAMENAESPNVDTNLSRMGVLGAMAGVGFAVGSIERVPLNLAKGAGLASMGFAVGMLLPETVTYVSSLPGDLARGFRHRDE